MEITPKLTDKAQRDYLLIQQALHKGDRRAYAELLNNYRESLYFLLLKMTNDVDDAEDLTIEAFGKAFKNLHQYSPSYAFSTWLFKIAANNCIDFMRKKRSDVFSMNQPIGEHPESEEFSGNIPFTGPDPEESFMKKQKARILQEVVEKLKPHYRQLVQLRYFRELSYEEIAEELNLPLGTVKAQLFRARELLSHILRNSEGAF